jgi:hypothetical protein
MGHDERMLERKLRENPRRSPQIAPLRLGARCFTAPQQGIAA